MKTLLLTLNYWKVHYLLITTGITLLILSILRFSSVGTLFISLGLGLIVWSIGLRRIEEDDQIVNRKPEAKE